MDRAAPRNIRSTGDQPSQCASSYPRANMVAISTTPMMITLTPSRRIRCHPISSPMQNSSSTSPKSASARIVPKSCTGPRKS